MKLPIKKNSLTAKKSKQKTNDTPSGTTNSKIKTTQAKSKVTQTIKTGKIINVTDEIDKIDSIDSKSTTAKKSLIIDRTGFKDTTDKKPAKTDKTVRIELNNVIEHEGKYYRGIQTVSEELAKKLLDIDKRTPDINRGAQTVNEELGKKLLNGKGGQVSTNKTKE